MIFDQTILAEFIDALASGQTDSLESIADRLLVDPSVRLSGRTPDEFPDNPLEFLRSRANQLVYAKADYTWNVLIPEVVAVVLHVCEDK